MLRLLAVVVLVAGAATLVAGLALAGGGNGSDEPPLTGERLADASAAALEHTGGGKVVDSEADGDGSLEVEIVREDGRQVEVTLDASLNVVGSEADDDGPEGSGDTADERAENGERD